MPDSFGDMIWEIGGGFGVKFLAGGVCREWLLGVLHPSGACCPYCGVGISERQRGGWLRLKKLMCGSCGRFFSGFTGTVFSGTKLSAEQIVLMLVGMDLGLEVKRIAELVGVSQQSIRFWKERLNG